MRVPSNLNRRAALKKHMKHMTVNSHSKTERGAKGSNRLDHILQIDYMRILKLPKLSYPKVEQAYSRTCLKSTFSTLINVLSCIPYKRAPILAHHVRVDWAGHPVFSSRYRKR